jgi:transposase
LICQTFSMDYQKIRNKISEGKAIVEKYKDETPKPVLEVCFSMFEINEMLVDKLEEIDNKISKNSGNSSVPPSRDPNRQRRERKKSKNQSGGQPGHKGSNLARVANPDAVVDHKPKGKCKCGKNIADLRMNLHSSRQIFEIEILKKAIEHRLFQTVCTCGESHCASYPAGVNAPAQYGASVQAIVAYLSKYQLIPYERIQELMTEIFSCPLSEGTVDNICLRSLDGLTEFETNAKEELLNQKMLHVDETPIRVENNKNYFHVMCNEAISLISHHFSRGMAAVVDIGVLDKFKGILIHDCYSMYFNYGGRHVVCNGHILRETKFIEEQYKFVWASQIQVFMWDLKWLVDESKKSGERVFDHLDAERFEAEYESILRRGRLEMKELILSVKNKGKVRGKQHPALNLCNRMLRLKKEILHFMYDFDIPFTNNEAERDLRMAKVHQKISGCFRSERGARSYALFRSYILTLKKQGLGIFEGIKNLFNPKKNATLDLIFKPQ